MALHLSPPDFSVTAVGTQHGTSRVVVTGEVDLATAPALAQTLDAELATGRPVVVDLRAVEFFDSAAVTVLIHATNDANVNGRDLTIAADLPPVVERVMKLSGVYEMLPLVDEP